MGLLLPLFAFSLSMIIITPLSSSISLSDGKTTTDLKNLFKAKPHTTSDQLLALNPFYQCDLYPRVCLLKGGIAPDCCKKKCVNVDTDPLNCGFCGNKCGPGEICCKAKCVNVQTNRSNCGYCGMKCRYNESCCRGKCKNTSFDKRNCGVCHNKCKEQETCAYGMCNYA